MRFILDLTFMVGQCNRMSYSIGLNTPLPEAMFSSTMADSVSPDYYFRRIKMLTLSFSSCKYDDTEMNVN